MSASALLSELRAAGVTLAATGDRLKIEAAPGIITPALTARLKAFKPELLAILAGNAAANDADERDTEPAQSLPIQSSFAEFERLFARLASLARYPADFCAEVLSNVRARMTPENARAEIDVVRELIIEWELAALPLQEDDRITCRDCVNRRTYDGVCKAAEVGGMVNAMRGYVPDATLPHRCAGFTPKPSAEDKRTGAERWPNLGTGEQ
jgi:hypothetical protein